jgi:hypothetical protein
MVRYKYMGEEKISILGTQYRYGEVVDLPQSPENMNLKSSRWIRADFTNSQESSYRMLLEINELNEDHAKVIAGHYPDPSAVHRAIYKKKEKLAGLDIPEKVVKKIEKKFSKFNEALNVVEAERMIAEETGTIESTVKEVDD